MYMRATTRTVVATMHPATVRLWYVGTVNGSLKLGITPEGGVRPGWAGAVSVYT